MKTKWFKKRKLYVPTAFLTIFALMFIIVIASWIGTAASDTIKGVGILDVFTSMWRGFVNKAEVILFIFALGGSIGIMTKIKAIDAGINSLVDKLGDRIMILIPILMLLFGLGGTTFGMWEETIAFIPVLIPVFRKAGYGAFTAILIILVGSGTGCLASTINPFATGAAVSSLNDSATLTSNMTASGVVFDNGTMQGVRWLSFAIFELIGISLVMWQAKRYKDKKDIVVGLDTNLINERFKKSKDIEFTTRRKISLAIFCFSFLLMIIAYLPWGTWIDGIGNDSNTFWSNNMWWLASTKKSGYSPIGEWGFISVAGLFLLSTVIIFLININDFKSKEENTELGFVNTYMNGIKEMVSVCMLIAIAAGLGVLLDTSRIGPSIANSISGAKMGLVAFGVTVFSLSLVLSLLIPSTSGFATAFIPIFAQVSIASNFGATGIGISIMAFLFASGIANLITPTSAALMGYTSYAGVPYPTWIKQVWKIVVVYIVVALAIVISISAIAASGSELF